MGHEVVLEGKEATNDLLVRITVVDEIEVVDGVEISRNYFAQAFAPSWPSVPAGGQGEAVRLTKYTKPN